MSSVPFAQLYDLMTQLGIVKVELVANKDKVIGIQTTDITGEEVQFTINVTKEGTKPEERKEDKKE